MSIAFNSMKFGSSKQARLPLFGLIDSFGDELLYPCKGHSHCPMFASHFPLKGRLSGSNPGLSCQPFVLHQPLHSAGRKQPWLSYLYSLEVYYCLGLLCSPLTLNRNSWTAENSSGCYIPLRYNDCLKSTEQQHTFNLSSEALASLFITPVYQKQPSGFTERALMHRQKSSTGHRVPNSRSLHVSVASF